MRRVRVEGKSYVVTYGRLLQVARQSLKQAQTVKEGSFHNLVSSIVFSAFSLEAYLNHLGSSLRPPGWVDRWPISKKLECILQRVGLTPDLSKRPFSSFDAMFRFRNLIAHGRTEEVTDDYETYLDNERSLVWGPMTEWELTCTHDNAERFLSDAKAMITAIHERTGLDMPAIGFLGVTGSSITPL
jgi:hypothetical protein